MLASIQLPIATEKVTVRDIPALFANALHPSIPEDTPRQITRLMKMPTTVENAENWCGAGCKPFPVSLTDDDMSALNAAWAKLPPLSLPISEAGWQSYMVAYEAIKQPGWELVIYSINPSLNARILRHSAETDWKKAVRQGAMNGQLEPKDPVSTLAEPQAGGEWLLDCFVTIANLTQFANRHDFDIILIGDESSNKKPTRNEWKEHALRKLLIELNEPGMTHEILARRYDVTRQSIGNTIKKAKTLLEPKKRAQWPAPLQATKK